MSQRAGKYGAIEGKTLEQQHERALTWVCDAYLFYLIAKHRRPVYRHLNGDIALNQAGLHGFIDGYFAEKWSVSKRMGMYVRMQDLRKRVTKKTGYFVDWGNIPELTPRATRWLNTMMDVYGDLMLEQEMRAENQESAQSTEMGL